MGLTAGWTSAAQASVFVSAADAALTPIGLLKAGMSYQITASGIADLLQGFNGGAGATFTADGKPTYALPAPFDLCNPGGCLVDPQNGSFGAAGPGKLFGALVGTFTANPVSYAQVFTIGLGTTIKPLTDEILYAIVNDDYYQNNDPTSGYNVSINAVPLPAALPSFGLALVALGGAALVRKRRRNDVASRVAATL